MPLAERARAVSQVCRGRGNLRETGERECASGGVRRADEKL